MKSKKTVPAYVPYTVSHDPQERIHTLQLWSSDRVCRGIPYHCILEFEFDASETVILHLPEPCFAIALKGTKLEELYSLLCEWRVQEGGESFAEVPPDKPCIRSIEPISRLSSG